MADATASAFFLELGLRLEPRRADRTGQSALPVPRQRGGRVHQGPMYGEEPFPMIGCAMPRRRGLGSQAHGRQSHGKQVGEGHLQRTHG